MIQTLFEKEKTTKEEKKRVGGVAQVVEHLPSTHKTLSSNPSTADKQTNK
jgi:hypothetical protein